MPHPLARGMPKAAQESLDSKKYALAIHNQPLLYHAHDFERFYRKSNARCGPIFQSQTEYACKAMTWQNLMTENEYSNPDIL